MSLVLVAGCSSKKAASTPPPTTTTTTATASVGATTTVPRFTGSSSSKYCGLARQFAQAITPTLSGDAQQLFQQFDAESGPFVAAAPSAIKSDVQTVVTVVKQLEAEFAAVNYDATKLTPANLAPVEAPSFAAASDRVNDYDVQVCGITPPTT